MLVRLQKLRNSLAIPAAFILISLTPHANSIQQKRTADLQRFRKTVGVSLFLCLHFLVTKYDSLCPKYRLHPVYPKRAISIGIQMTAKHTAIAMMMRFGVHHIAGRFFSPVVSI